jgi:autophagy-related protein 2
MNLYPQEFLVTLRLHKATLRHYMALPEQSWHSQVSKVA